MNVPELLQRLEGVKQNGKGWMARCPAHDDRTPSLSLAESDDGKVLLNCYAGCSLDAVCGALGITAADLFPPKAKVAPGRIVATYDYKDEGGKLLFQAVRYEPKNFKQRRPKPTNNNPDPANPNDWIWNLQDVRRTLFHLPELLVAVKEERPVYIAEGEKDVLALEDAGFAATCNAGGALSKPDDNKWHDSFTQALKGAEVIVIADKDTPGRRHADIVASKLHGFAASVKVLELPDVGDKQVKDAADYFAAGGQPADLDDMAESTPVWTPRENQAAPNKSERPRFANLGGQPCIVVLPGDEVTITASASNLYKLIAPTHQLFVRGKVVVALGRTITGQLVLQPVLPSAARSLFETFGSFVVWRTGQHGAKVLKPTVIPEETAKALLHCHVAAEILPAVNGLVNSPILVDTGHELKVCAKGYSAETGLLILKGETTVDVPLEEAVQTLKGLLEDFHFQSPSDLSRAMAAFITPALKMGNLIRGHVPADVAEADQSQSGKTYRQKMLAAIYGESPALVPLKHGGVGGTDESFYEKLVNGRPFIQLDNYRGMLDSSALEAFMTAEGAFPCRIPRCPEIEVDPSRFFILMTSNGVETTRDFANRASIVRIYKRPGVQFPDTLGTIIARQPHYLGCVFAVVREWYRQGKPRTTETRHDFREWCQVLDWIVQHVCDMAPLMDGHQNAQERVSNPALTFLRRIAIEIERQNALDEPLTASQLYELAETGDVPVPGLSKDDAHNEDQGKKVIGCKLAPIFKTSSSVELDGYVITRGEGWRKREDDKGLSSFKTYTFRRASALAHHPQQPQQPQQPLQCLEK